MRTRGLVIKKQNTNEYDQLITCYTQEFGKITAIAKSVLKSNSIQAMHLDVLNLVDFELINGRGIPIIAGAQAEHIYPSIKGNIQALAVAYFFNEVIDKIVFEYQRDDELWGFLSDFINKLDKKAETSEELIHFFREKQTELLHIMGHYPNMEECALCSKENTGNYVAFSTEVGGIICNDCFLQGHRGVLMRNTDLSSDEVLDSIFESIGEKRLDSLSFIKSVLQL